MSDEVDVGCGEFLFRCQRNTETTWTKHLGVRLCWGTPRPNKGPAISVSVILCKICSDRCIAQINPCIFGQMDDPPELFLLQKLTLEEFLWECKFQKNFQRRCLTVVEQGSLGKHGQELEGNLHLHVRLSRQRLWLNRW